MTLPAGGRSPAGDRGQTLQDFVLGISIFIVAFVVVLSMLPGLLTPFQQDVSAEREAAAERVAATIVTNLSQPAQPNYLEPAATNDLFARSTGEIKTRFNLSDPTQVNVTLENLDGSTRLRTVGDTVTRNQTATSVRIVNVSLGSGCDPACRLVVRTW